MCNNNINNHEAMVYNSNKTLWYVLIVRQMNGPRDIRIDLVYKWGDPVRIGCARERAHSPIDIFTFSLHRIQ